MEKKIEIPTFDRYALFETGGKQYQAIPGKTIEIEKLNGEAGDAVEFSTVLFRKLETGKFEFGKPFLQDVKVKASIIKQSKGPKLIVFKFKRRKKYRVKKGHRQQHTILRIESI